MDMHFIDYDPSDVPKKDTYIKCVSCFTHREINVVLDLLGRQKT